MLWAIRESRTSVLLKKLSALLSKHTRITDQILKQAEQVQNLNSFAWSPTTFGTYSLTATDCWEKLTQRPTCSITQNNNIITVLSRQSFVASLMKHTFFSKLVSYWIITWFFLTYSMPVHHIERWTPNLSKPLLNLVFLCFTLLSTSQSNLLH